MIEVSADADFLNSVVWLEPEEARTSIPKAPKSLTQFSEKDALTALIPIDLPANTFSELAVLHIENTHLVH